MTISPYIYIISIAQTAAQTLCNQPWRARTTCHRVPKQTTSVRASEERSEEEKDAQGEMPVLVYCCESSSDDDDDDDDVVEVESEEEVCCLENGIDMYYE